MDSREGGEGGGKREVHPRLKFASECELEKVEENKIWYCKTVAGLFLLFLLIIVSYC